MGRKGFRLCKMDLPDFIIEISMIQLPHRVTYNLLSSPFIKTILSLCSLALLSSRRRCEEILVRTARSTRTTGTTRSICGHFSLLQRGGDSHTRLQYHEWWVQIAYNNNTVPKRGPNQSNCLSCHFLERGIARGPPGPPGPPGPSGAGVSGFSTATIDYTALIRSNATSSDRPSVSLTTMKSHSLIICPPSSPSQIQNSAHGSALPYSRVLLVLLVSQGYLVLQDLRDRQESLQLCTGQEAVATAWRTSSVTCKVSQIKRMSLMFEAL